MGAHFILRRKFMEPLKNPTTFDEQVNLLHDKGVVIPDPQQCIKLLSTANYYRLTGYLLHFKKPGEDKCFMDVDIHIL